MNNVRPTNEELKMKSTRNTNRLYEFKDKNVLAIKTIKGDIYIVDLEDKEKVEYYAWSTSSNGYPCRHKFYIDENGNKHNKYLGLNRVIMGVTDPKICVDHKTRNRFDNRKSNMRTCTHQQNDCNKIKANQNPDMIGIETIKGKRGNRYVSRITINNEYIHLGTYDTLEEARIVRREAEEKYFGEFAPGLCESDGVYEEISIRVNGLIDPFIKIDREERYIINPFKNLLKEEKINPFTFTR